MNSSTSKYNLTKFWFENCGCSVRTSLFGDTSELHSVAWVSVIALIIKPNQANIDGGMWVINYQIVSISECVVRQSIEVTQAHIFEYMWVTK